MESANPKWELFDDQAAGFEDRAGLPPVYCAGIASAVTDLANLGPGDLIVEIGPGAGRLGVEFRSPLRYIALDLSAGMLNEFRRRAGGRESDRLLVRADARDAWPLVSGKARAFFSSRALHLLPVDHVAGEVFRLAAPPQATLVIGRISRDRESVRSRMAREMNERLRRHGHEAHRGELSNRKLLELCKARGAEVLEPRASRFIVFWPHGVKEAPAARAAAERTPLKVTRPGSTGSTQTKRSAGLTLAATMLHPKARARMSGRLGFTNGQAPEW